jgi:hypothetical protein
MKKGWGCSLVQSACLECTRPWVPSSIPQENENEEAEGQIISMISSEKIKFL